jgi:hypothetical protein
MEVRFTAHALKRLEDRAIEPDWAEAAIREPDWTESDPSDPEITRFFRVGLAGDNRILRVAGRLEEKVVVVVTAFFDRGARRRSE